MKLKRKERIFLIIIGVLAVLLSAGIFFLIGNSANKKQQINEEKMEDTTIDKDPIKQIENKETERTLEFDKFYLLESYFTVIQIQELEDQITEFLTQDQEFDLVEKVICSEGAIGTENKVEFFCTLDKRDDVLCSVYSKKTKKFRFWIEAKSQEQMEQEWKEKQDNILQTETWEEEEKLPCEWNYQEEDNTPVTISEKQLLNGKISDEELKELDAKVLEFLEDNHEYRRKIKIQKEVKETKIAVEFYGEFETPRLDKKRLHIVYNKKDKKFQFALEE